MDNAKENAAVEKTAGENPNPTPNAPSEPESVSEAVNPNPNANTPSRTPFTSLGQVDADLALARALQEQERAYMMLRMDGDVGGYGSSGSGSYVYEDELGEEEEEDDHHHLDHPDEDHGSVEGSDYGEDAFDANDEELNPADFESDEAFARALQDAEEREVAVRLMALAGLNDWGVVERGDHVRHPQIDRQGLTAIAVPCGSLKRLEHLYGASGMAMVLDFRQRAVLRLILIFMYEDTEGFIYGHGRVSFLLKPEDAWQEVDPDELSYEELIALGEVVGTESRGLSADTIASLPSVNYKAQSSQNGITDQCVICRLDYEDGDSLVALSCKHLYHPECINQWLQINKVCPICSCEVSTSSGQ